MIHTGRWIGVSTYRGSACSGAYAWVTLPHAYSHAHGCVPMRIGVLCISPCISPYVPAVCAVVYGCVCGTLLYRIIDKMCWLSYTGMRAGCSPLFAYLLLFTFYYLLSFVSFKTFFAFAFAFVAFAFASRKYLTERVWGVMMMIQENVLWT